MKKTWFFTCLIFIFERGHANTENRTQNETDDPCEDFQVFLGDFDQFSSCMAQHVLKSFFINAILNFGLGNFIPNGM